jgi:DNA adenine methylase
MIKNRLIAPFVKWVGGKRQLMPTLLKLFPKNITNYVEPFIGGGAVLFELQPKNAIINDLNSELINAYNVIKTDLDELIEDLKKHEKTSDYFYELRSLDRVYGYHDLTQVQRASRIIFLNKTCYNGLYRVNNAGEFNSPYGNYKNPNIVNEVILRAVSNYLTHNNISIYNEDFEKTLNRIHPNSFVYLDPPYHPISQSSNFTGYNQGGFNIAEQKRLRNACKKLDSKGIKFCH